VKNIIQIRKAQFEEQLRIAVFTPKQDDFITKIRQVPNCRWSAFHLCWHFPYDTEHWGLFKSLFQDETLNIQNKEEPLQFFAYEMLERPILEVNMSETCAYLPTLESEDDNAPLASVTAVENIEHQAFIKQFKKDNPEKILVTKADFWEGKLRVDVPYRPDWVNFMKNLPGRYWHTDKKCWSVPHSPLIIDKLKNTFGDILHMEVNAQYSKATTYSKLNPNKNKKPPTDTPPQYQDEVLRLIEKMTLKRMSHHTIKTYKSGFTQFLHYYNDIHPKDITKEQIIAYMMNRIKEDKISATIQNNFINAIKCYYEFVLGRDRIYYDLQRPKKPFSLPNVLSQSEFIDMMKVVQNVKHRCILLALYSGGLRLSEVINLRKADIKLGDNCIFVKGGKGKKDRYTLLSQTFIDELAIYQQEYNTAYWLFEGDTGGQYAPRSVQYVLRNAVEKSGINPFATVHTLRHSFATHLVLAGHDIISVQKLLGHESPITTEIYVHLTGEQVRRIQSPLDRLNL
jgi:integrase/recombinase XerD